MDQPTDNLTDAIPSSRAVREGISTRLLEVALLRSLLKVSERKERTEGRQARTNARPNRGAVDA